MLRLIVSRPSESEAADAAVSARLIADWLAADGDVIARARIEWEAEQYDPALLDELAALRDTPAAA